MYLGIDIGGTKTLVAALTNEGVLHEQQKFATPKKYPEFVTELENAINTLETKDFRAAGVAAPGRIDREHGVAERFGNLTWRNAPIQQDVERLAHCPAIVENDANLAGLSEAMLLKDTHAKVLYITISTGIGTGYIVDQKIDPSMADSEGGDLMIQRGDRIMKWESFASGSAIVKRYGKRAEDIEDEKTWRTIANDLSVGFLDLMAVTQPDIIVVGGGVGRYLHRFQHYLVEELKEYENPLLPIPPIHKAQRPDEAVIYGCFDIAREKYPPHSSVRSQR